jgi:alkylation response protein AidB-like acyl-CoA dehydrogenase
MQSHGGHGYTKDCDVERHRRDVKLREIVERTREIQRLVIARHLVGA